MFGYYPSYFFKSLNLEYSHQFHYSEKLDLVDFKIALNEELLGQIKPQYDEQVIIMSEQERLIQKVRF